MTATHAPSLR